MHECVVEVEEDGVLRRDDLGGAAVEGLRHAITTSLGRRISQ
jgi:hypothetical protein